MNRPQRISAEELNRHIAAGEDALIIDVRSAEEYRTLHAAGARLLPLERVNERSVFECLGEADDNVGRRLYFICHSGRRAAEACERVLERFPDACLVEGGTLAWAQAGLPVRHGEQP